MTGRDREAGLSLAEVVVAVAIFGIAFTAIVGGLGGALITSDVDRRAASGQNGLRTLAEDVLDDPYDACPGTPSYGGSFTPPAGFTTTVAVEYWGGVAFLPACPVTDLGLQRVALALVSTDGKISESVQVLKRTP